VVLEGSGRKVCPASAVPDRTERIVQAGIRVFEARKQTGVDPSHGGEAAQRRGKKMRQRTSKTRVWDTQHPRPDPEVFRCEILPLLRSLPIRRIAREVGISPRYASLIRRGEYVPYPRWWGVLRSLAKAAEAPTPAALNPYPAGPTTSSNEQASPAASHPLPRVRITAGTARPATAAPCPSALGSERLPKSWWPSLAGRALLLLVASQTPNPQEGR
jgi:transcriptional regulator with XRE-family HTH domain